MRFQTPLFKIAIACASSFFLFACNNEPYAPSVSETSVSDTVSEERPNIVLIITDNQPIDTISAYADKGFKTPNIDTLANDGVLFENMFSVNAVCSPTRASLMTGLIPSQTGVHFAQLKRVIDEAPHEWNAIDEFRNLPQTLKEAGYETALIGKYHLGSPYKPQHQFDEWVTFTSGHTVSFHETEIIENDRRYMYEGHITDFWTEKADTYIREQTLDKPFFLMLTYNGPYNLPPVITKTPDNRFVDDYDNSVPSYPEGPPHEFLQNWVDQSKGDISHGINAGNAVSALNNPSVIKNLASEVAMVDDGVGKVMQALKDRGIDENTLVIFTSDQGSNYGQHGLYGNASWARPTIAYDSHMRVPLIVKQVGRTKQGVRNELLVSQYDFFPTLLDYLGLDDKVIAHTPGQSFANAFTGEPIATWKDAIFYDNVHTRAMRTHDWKYVKRFLNDPYVGELYDLNADPEEKNNLFNEPEYKDVIAKLDTKFEAFFSTYADPKYDLWKGGTGKANLVPFDNSFKQHFSEWQSPTMEVVTPFTDL